MASSGGGRTRRSSTGTKHSKAAAYCALLLRVASWLARINNSFGLLSRRGIGASLLRQLVAGCWPDYQRRAVEAVTVARFEPLPLYPEPEFEGKFCKIVGGVLSPLLANLYMNRFLKHWRREGRDRVFQAKVVNYADDFVILSCGCAAEALTWTSQVMTRLGLSLNEAKTSVRNARRECFDFLGYTFGPHRSSMDGHQYMGASPSRKSVQRLKAKVSDVLVPGNQEPWPDIRNHLNSLLRGWSAYFSHGTRRAAYRAVDNYVYQQVRCFLNRRHKVPSQGTSRHPAQAVFGRLGVLRLRRVQLGAPP